MKIKIGQIKTIIKIEIIVPVSVSRTASCAFPSNSNLWAGRTVIIESSEGTPRKIDGIISKKTWVIDIEIIITINDSSFSFISLDKENKIAATIFICIPGVRPVIIPNKQPTKINNISNMNYISLKL